MRIGNASTIFTRGGALGFKKVELWSDIMSSFLEGLSKHLIHFKKALKVPYAFQFAYRYALC